MSAYYTTQVGPVEWSRWYRDDRHARQVAARWIRIRWERYVAQLGERAPLYKASIAYDMAINDPWCRVYRRPHDPRSHVILCERPVRVDAYALEP